MKSNEFLQAAIDVQKERGAQYDKPSGERSMAATVAAFNCITGHNLKEQDGWMLQGLLKLVRQSQNPESYHHDSALDFVAYASLYAEASSEQCKPSEDARKTGGVIKSDMTYIVGESASEQCVPNNSIPSWARWIATDQDGERYCYENTPEIDEEHPDNLCWFCNSGKVQFLGNVKKPFNARTTLLSLDQQ